MIINIRGTSGAGKSTLVRSVMAAYNLTSPVNVAGRKQPYYYELNNEDPMNTHRRPLVVIGHYNTPCGGCDTIKTPNEVYQIVNHQADLHRHVLYEGIMVMDDVRRAVELHERLPGQLLVVGLTTPVEACLEAVRGRRAARGDARPLDPKNTTQRAKSCERGLSRLEAAGVAVERLDRAAALARVLGLFGVGA